jgi:Flp pilus assembly protein TadG
MKFLVSLFKHDTFLGVHSAVSSYPEGRQPIMDNQITSAFKGYHHNHDGNIALMTAIILPVITGIAGLAVIYLQGFQQKTMLQSGLDSGVLAGTAMNYKASDADRIAAAEAAFYANVKNGEIFSSDSVAEFVAEGTPKPTFTVKKTSVSGVAVAKVENSLGAALGISNVTIEARAKAAKRQSEPLCLLTLGESAPKSIYVYGNAHLDADCPVQANSEDSEAISISGAQSKLTASIIGVTGGSSGSGISPAPITGTQPVTDPFADLPVPLPGACKMTDAVIKTTQTLNSGTYCGGLNVKTGATVTLNPGIYIMLDGQLLIDSGGRLEGEEVMIALVGKDSTIAMGSDSFAKLTSPVSGTYKNIQFMSDRELSQSKFEEEWTTIKSGATLEYDGVMYLPEQNFWVSGTAHQAIIKAYSPAHAIVTNTVWAQGNAVLEIHQEDRRDIGEVHGSGFNYSARLVK